MKKKKLAICITIYEKGGQSVLIEEIHKLMKDEYEMHIICEKCTRDVDPVFKIIETKAWVNRYIPVLTKEIVPLLKQYDVIHCYDSISYMFAAAKSKKPFVVTTVGNPPYWVRGTLKGAIDAILSNIIYQWGYNKAHVIVAFSKYLKIWMKKRYNKKSVLLDLGVNREIFKPISKKEFIDLVKGSPQLLYVGQISEKKGCDELLYGMHKLKDIYPKFTLQIIGFGEDYYLKKFKDQISKYKLEKNIDLVGYLDSKEINKYYNACDVFITPSRWEGFGLPILEAMAVGKPCVALNKFNTKYLILDSKAGCVFNNKKDIHKAVIDCIENYEVYSKNAIKFSSAKNFEWHSHAKGLKRIYKKLLNK